MESIEEGFYYHIYNRGAGKNNLFFDKYDFLEFNKRFIYYLYPVTQIYAWCLLQNHFHFLIRVRTTEEQVEFYQRRKEYFLDGYFHGKVSPKEKPYIFSRQFSHFMNYYTRYVNNKLGRSGTLIQGPLKRKRVVDSSNLINLICYIHRNPIHHHISPNYEDYIYSSYSDFVSEKKSFIERKRVYSLFGGRENFIEAHKEFKMNLIESHELFLD